MPPCSHCDGRGETRVLACTLGKGCVFRVIRCVFCQGAGELSEEQLAREARGSALRHLRKSLNLSGREAATILGMDPIAFNHLEWGKAGTTLEQIGAAIRQLTIMIEQQRFKARRKEIKQKIDNGIRRTSGKIV